eukprot:12725683-Alexandrium_andersonii.AAC.1
MGNEEDGGLSPRCPEEPIEIVPAQGPERKQARRLRHYLRPHIGSKCRNFHHDFLGHESITICRGDLCWWVDGLTHDGGGA